jgi:serine/threonine protein kinase
MAGGPAAEREQPGFTRPSTTSEAFLSRTGVAIGTSAYMSPEQARGEKLDARTDIFSLGLVFYEMATGHRAFEGATEPILHDAIFRQNPTPVRQINPVVPVKFEAIIEGTATTAIRRPRSCTQIWRPLERLPRAATHAAGGSLLRLGWWWSS